MIPRILLFLVILVLALPSAAHARATPLNQRNPMQGETTVSDKPKPRAIPILTPLPEPDLPKLQSEKQITEEATPESAVPARAPAPLKEEDVMDALVDDVVEPDATTPVLAMGSAYTEKGLRIALLLPLSGPLAARGEALLNAAEMALFDAQSDNTLIPVDIGATPATALQAMDAAIDARPDIILGPLSTDIAIALKDTIKAANLPAITFSDNPALAADGYLVFGFSPEAQAERVVKYAAGHGVTVFSALVPDSPLGNMAVEALKGVKNNKVEKYGKVPEAKLALMLSSPAANPPEEEHTEGLLLVEGGDKLVKIADGIVKKPEAVKRFQLMGLSEWDDRALTRQASLDGAWFAVTPPEVRYQFEARYKDIYGTEPPREASLGYDAVALLAVLSQGNHHPTHEEFFNPVGFAGINGIFRFGKDGIVERLMGVAEITKDGFVLIDPVPEGF